MDILNDAIVQLIHSNFAHRKEQAILTHLSALKAFRLNDVRRS